MDNLVFFPFISRVLFGSYGLMMYVFRLFVPVRMAAFYPYPAINTSLPAIYYASPLFSAVLAGLCAWTWFRRRSRVVTFGIAFYVVNLLLVLQVLTVGSAVMADRYTYVPYIGLFFILGYGLDWWMSRSPVSLAPTAVTGVAALVLTGTAFGQASTWKNGAALWDHALRVCPSARAYVNRGTLLRKEGNNARALAMYSEALRLNKKDHEAFANRGNIYFDMGENDKAMRDYDHALAIKPDFSTVLANRASLYSRLQKYDAALADFGKAIALKPDDAPPYKNRALTLMVLKRYDGAVKDFEKYLRFDPDNAGIYNEIGVCYQGMGKYEESLAPLTRAIKLADNPTFLLNRSISYNHLGREREAMADIAAARRLGATTTPGFLSGLGLAAPTGGKPATTAPVPSYPANPLTAGPSPVDRGATVRATNAQH